MLFRLDKKENHGHRRRLPAVLIVLFLVASCVPKEAVQFRSIRNITLETNPSGEPLLKGEAVFYNPNAIRMKLREISVEISVDGKKSARVDQKPDQVIPANAEFSINVEARLSLKEIGLLDAMINLLGGKKYDIQYNGYLRVRVHGVTVKIPIRYKDEIRLKI